MPNFLKKIKSILNNVKSLFHSDLEIEVAISLGDIILLKQLLDNGANVKKPININDTPFAIVDEDPSITMSPLFLAVKMQDSEMVECLGTRGAHLEENSAFAIRHTGSHGEYFVEDKCTSLGLSILQNDLTIAHILLNLGANPNALLFYYGKGETPIIQIAFSHNFFKGLSALYAYGADIKGIEDKSQFYNKLLEGLSPDFTEDNENRVQQKALKRLAGECRTEDTLEDTTSTSTHATKTFNEFMSKIQDSSYARREAAIKSWYSYRKDINDKMHPAITTNHEASDIISLNGESPSKTDASTMD